MKFGFVTCVELGLSCIKAIYSEGYNLELAITLNDSNSLDKSGRVYLDDFCKEKSIHLEKCNHINDPHISDTIRRADIDWLFIVGWSQIAGTEVLRAPKMGVLGMHPTLLPVGRGRAAIPWAILKELPETGVTLFKVDEGVDTGLIGGQLVIPLHNRITASELYNLVNNAHVELVKNILPLLILGAVSFEAQDVSRATEWPGRKPEDGEIDLDGSVFEAERLIRAVTRPYPGAFFFQDGKKVIVWRAEMTGKKPDQRSLVFRDGFLTLLEIDEIKV
ncbi:formyltransferase family protein [Alphaproteobacteria bacterium LSUCC0396]